MGNFAYCNTMSLKNQPRKTGLPSAGHTGFPPHSRCPLTPKYGLIFQPLWSKSEPTLCEKRLHFEYARDILKGRKYAPKERRNVYVYHPGSF